MRALLHSRSAPSRLGKEDRAQADRRNSPPAPGCDGKGGIDARIRRANPMGGFNEGNDSRRNDHQGNGKDVRRRTRIGSKAALGPRKK